MNRHYYKEACMCRNPMPSRIMPERCAWCGGILPPAVRAMHSIERELRHWPRGEAIWGLVFAMVVLFALWAMAHITLIASEHDPNPPTSLAQDIPTERR